MLGRTGGADQMERAFNKGHKTRGALEPERQQGFFSKFGGYLSDFGEKAIWPFIIIFSLYLVLAFSVGTQTLNSSSLARFLFKPIADFRLEWAQIEGETQQVVNRLAALGTAEAAIFQSEEEAKIFVAKGREMNDVLAEREFNSGVIQAAQQACGQMMQDNLRDISSTTAWDRGAANIFGGTSYFFGTLFGQDGWKRWGNARQLEIQLETRYARESLPAIKDCLYKHSDGLYGSPDWELVS